MGKIKLSYLFVLVGLNKVIPIIETRGKMPGQFQSLLRRPKKEQTSMTNRNVKLSTIVVGVFNRNLPC